MIGEEQAFNKYCFIFGMRENEYKDDARDFFCVLPRTTTRTTSSAANDYAPSSSCADEIAPSCLDDRHCARHACAYNQSEESYSSLKIEEVEERPCTNQDGCHTGIEPGACS